MTPPKARTRKAREIRMHINEEPNEYRPGWQVMHRCVGEDYCFNCWNGLLLPTVPFREVLSRRKRQQARGK